MPLHRPQADDLREIGHFGLAIKRTQNGFFHTGMFFRDDGDNVRMLHLAWHYKLCNDSPAATYTWCDITSLDPLTAEQAAIACRSVWELHGGQGLPYSFINDTEFREDFSLVENTAGSGFTCATFILRVLENIGLRLIDTDTWEHRDEDKAWQEYIIESLDKQFGDEVEDHIARLKSATGIFRFQPLDLVAATEFEHTATFKEIEPRRLALMEQIPA